MSGKITHSISDKLIQFVILDDFITPKPLSKTNVYKRNFDKFDNNNLKEDLHKICWINEMLKNGNDINEIFDIVYKTPNEIFHHLAPLNKVTKKERTLQSKPWINKKIKHFIRKRDKLFRKYFAQKNETQKKINHEEFRKMRNNVTFSIRKSKNEYFKLFFFHENRNNNTLIWKRIWQLITLSSKSKVHPNIVKVKGKDIINPAKIADALTFF